MTHTDRKSFVLPCGKTLGDSWGALRKSWHGFKIAHNNGDADRMRKYAEFIRKIQLQMAIDLTPFDLDLLDQETIGRIENEVKMQEKAMAENCRAESNALTGNSNVGERNYDYDTLLTEGKNEIKPIDLPAPNEEKFDVYYDRKKGRYVSKLDVIPPEYYDREKGCYVRGQMDTGTTADVSEYVRHADRSVDYPPKGPKKAANPKSEGNGHNETNSCYHKSIPGGSREDKGRNGCYYKSKPKPEPE